MNTIAPPNSYVNRLHARKEFKATLFLLRFQQLPWKAFGILVASLNGKNCQQPRVPRVCDFKELLKELLQTISIREHPEDRF